LGNTKRLGIFATSSNHNSDSLSYFDDLMPLWNRTLFSPHRSSLEKVLARVNKTIEKSRKFFNKIESKKQSSINRANSVPEKATIRQEYIKCGKMLCMQEDGPYYYAYWKGPDSNTRS
jgi:hypothetical protein